jgi:predicted amidohydrolase
MRTALVQVASPDDESMAARVQRVGRIVAGLDDPELIVLPELWAPGYFAFDSYDELAQPLDGPFIAEMKRWARESGAHLQIGSFLERTADHLYNTAVLLSPAGEIVQTYRKMHVFGYQSLEAELLTPGTEIAAGTVGGLGGVGMTTCYDLRFPELYRRIVDGGAELILIPAAWPSARLEHWRLLTRTRALESQLYVVACGAGGTQRGVELSGHSVIVDPWGEVVAEGGFGEDVVYADIDLGRVGAIRSEFPALADRVLP